MKHVHAILLAVTAATAAFMTTSCSPDDPRTELQNAHKLMLQKHFAEALPKTASCLSLDSQNADAIIANALCVYNMSPKDPDACKNARLNLARAVTTVARDRFDAHYTYTWLLMQDEDFDNALGAAYRARDLFRRQHNPPIPTSATCDLEDLNLAKTSMPYANLILMIADICRHNSLDEGLPYFRVALNLKIFAAMPEVHLAYSQLLLERQRTREAYTVIRNATFAFPEDLACAYNYAVIDEIRRRGMKLPPELHRKLIHKYDRALTFAHRYGNTELVRRISQKIAALRKQQP